MDVFSPSQEAVFVGVFLECFLYGLYSGMFIIYIQHQKNEPQDKRTTIRVVFYSLCVLYALSGGVVAIDIARWTVELLGNFNFDVPDYVSPISIVLIACCDYIAQSILIYRCWIAWSHDIRVVIVPAFLSFTFFAIWLSHIAPQIAPAASITLLLTCLSLSLTVNALVTGLIVFKIVKVYLKVKPTMEEKRLGSTGGAKLRSVIFVLIESGMALFVILLARLVLSALSTNAASIAVQPIIYIHQMLNGMTPTLIQVRVSMGLSFDDEKSMEDVTSTLRFDHSKSTRETDTTISIEEDKNKVEGTVDSNDNVIELT